MKIQPVGCLDHLNVNPQVNSMFGAIFGKSPSLIQIVSTLIVSLGAAALVIVSSDFDWKLFIVAIIAADWAGGVVANSTENTRVWWRSRPRARAGFYAVHIAEIPVVWWLTGGELIFFILLLVLLSKLSAFAFGK